MATLRELYGPGVEKVSTYNKCYVQVLISNPVRSVQLKIDQRVFVTPSKRKLDVNVVQSNYHIELTPS
jgi:replication factor C subunit 3/5